MDPKPNIHYIGVIENDGERVVYKKYPIELPRSLLDSLESMQDNAEKTILDMQSEVERYYPPDERGRFLSDYLAPRYYGDTYVGCTYFPKIVTVQEFECNKSITVREAVAQYDKYVEERRVNGSTSLGQTRDAYVAEKVASWNRANKVVYRIWRN